MERGNPKSGTTIKMSFAEGATAFTAMCIGLSYVFNLGFFSSSNWNYISLLTVQDVAVSALLGSGPFLVFIALASREGIENYSRESERSLFIRGLLVAIAMFILLVVKAKSDGDLYDAASITIGVLALTLAYLAIYYAIKNVKTSLHIRFLNAGIITVICVFFIGQSSYDFFSGDSRFNTSYTLANGNVLPTNTVRLTSNYAFYVQGRQLHAIALSSVTQIEQTRE